MMDLNKLVRPNILSLKAYTSARDEFSARDAIFFDANENPFGKLNRYPDPYQKELKELLGTKKGVEISSVFIGNGSDELIDLLFRIFCNPGIDKALCFNPSYGIYEVSSAVNAIELIKLELDEDFEIQYSTVHNLLDDSSLKLILICSPNNPTGNSLSSETIEQIIENFKGIVLIDEAYMDFSDKPSFIEKIADYPNLIISQTLSKAWGLAAARIGIAYANPEIIALLNKVKAPYNISELNQKAAIETLKDDANFELNKRLILSEKERLRDELIKLEIVKQIYPSDANFLLIEFSDAIAVYDFLVSQKLIVRNRHSLVRNCLRITVASAEDNQKLIQTLKTINL